MAIMSRPIDQFLTLGPRRPYRDGLTVPRAHMPIHYGLLCLVGRHPWNPWEAYYFHVQPSSPDRGVYTHYTRSCQACGKVEDTGRAS